MDEVVAVEPEPTLREAAVAAAGFEIEECRRFGFAPAALMPKLPHLLGRARRA